MCYLNVVCENNDEKIAVERTLINTFKNSDINGIADEICFVLGNVLYGIEVQNHWFITSDVFETIKQGIIDNESKISADKPTVIYDSYIGGIHFKIRHAYKSKNF